MTEFSPKGQHTHWLNAERVNVYSWIFLVIFSIFLGSLIYESFISTTAKDPRPDRDFITFYAAAELAQAGKAVDLSLIHI